jgi:hypothetical protein
MDVIVSLPNVSKADLRAFSRCRIYYGVARLSEIASADGTLVARDAWEGSRLRLSPTLWPYQPKPGPKSFRVWRRLLATAFLQWHRKIVSAHTIDLSRRRPLGRWLPASEAFRYHWTSFYSPSKDRLFLLSPDDDTQFTCHDSRKIRRRPKHPVRAFSEATVTVVTVLPSDTSPVDYRTEPNKLFIPVHVPKIVPPAQPPPYISTWPEYVANLPPWEQALLLSVNFVDKQRILVALRTAGRLFLASDGGAAAKILVECGGRAHGADPGSF